MVGDELHAGEGGISWQAIMVVVGKGRVSLVSAFGRHFNVVGLVEGVVCCPGSTAVGLCVPCPNPVQ